MIKLSVFFKMKRTSVLRMLFAGLLFGMTGTVNVLHAALKPGISQPPVGGTYAKEADARFSVNAYSLDTGYLTYQWYRSLEYTAPQTLMTDAQIREASSALDASFGSVTEATLNTTTPSVTGTRYFYYWVRVTNNKDGVSDYTDSPPVLVKIVNRELETELKQGNFEGLTHAAGWPDFVVELGLYWNTTHDGYTSDPTTGYTGTTTNPRKVLEVSVASTYGTTANHSSNVSELSPWVPCSNYQDIATVPGKIYEWSLEHGARYNSGEAIQVMAVVIGPAINLDTDYADFGITYRWVNNTAVTPNHYPYGTNYTTYFYDIVNKLASDLGTTVALLRTMSPSASAPYTTTYGGNKYYVYISADNKDQYFVSRSGVYTVPEGQGTTVFGFVPITIQNASGNLIDDVVFTSASSNPPSTAITYSNAVSLSAVTKAGYVYGLAEVRGSSVSLVSGAQAYYDPDGSGTSPEALISVNPTLGNDNCWYSTYGSNAAFAAGGIITFRNLTPGKTYRLVGIPLLAVNEGLGTNMSPEYVYDAGYYRDMQTRPAYEGDEASSVWNIDLEAYTLADGVTQKARVSVKNAKNDVEYALLRDDGTGKPLTTESAYTAPLWTPETAGRATFDSLNLDAWYYLVARPYKYSEISYADAAYDGAEERFLKIKTPGTVVDIAPINVSRTNCSVIKLENSKTGYTYAVVDPVTGEIVDGTQPGDDGGTLYFDVPDQSKAYQIMTKSGDVKWMKGVRVYGCIHAFTIDYLQEAVRSTQNANGYIPTDVEYNICETDSSTWIIGGPDSWIAGIGSQTLSLSGNISGTTRSILDSLQSLNSDAWLNYRARIGSDGYTGAAVSPHKTMIIPKRPDAPTTPANYAFAYDLERINALYSGGLQFAQINSAWTTVPGSGNWTFLAAGWGEGVSRRPFNVRFPATTSAFASVVRTDTIPARPAAPDVGIKINSAITRIVITGIIPLREYETHVNAGTSWSRWAATANESDSITFATPDDTCFVRFPATSALPASFITLLTATPLNIGSVYFDNYDYGADPVPETVVIKNSLDALVDIDSVVLEDDRYYNLSVPANSGDKQVSPNGTNTNWTLTPKPGLDAGNYNTRLILNYTYNNIDYIAYAEVYLTVDKAEWDMSGISGVFDVSKTQQRQLVLKVSGAPPDAILSFYYGSEPILGSPQRSVVAGDTIYTFTAANGLEPAVTYSVGVVAGEDNNHYASSTSGPISLAEGHTAYETPVFSDVVHIDYTEEKVVFNPNYVPNDYKYILRCSTCDGAPVIPSPYSLSDIIENNPDFELSIVYDAGAPYPASEPAFSGNIKGRLPAPAVDCGMVTHVSGSSMNSGAIHIADAVQYEYHLRGTTQPWVSFTGTATGLGVGDYDVRYPVPNPATAFASKSALVTISSGITGQPAPHTDVSYLIRDTLSVTIPPTVNTVEYSWYRCNADKSSPLLVSSTAENRYPIPETLPQGTYYYYCKIAIGGCPLFESDVATVTVSPQTRTVQQYYWTEIDVPNEYTIVQHPEAGTLSATGTDSGSRLIYLNTGTDRLTDNIDSLVYRFSVNGSEFLATVYIYILKEIHGASTCRNRLFTATLQERPTSTNFRWYTGKTVADTVYQDSGTSYTFTTVTGDTSMLVKPLVPSPWNRADGFPPGLLTIHATDDATIHLMRWTGLRDTSWHNPENWVEMVTETNGRTYETPVAWSPTACTDVVIASGAPNWPELTDSAWCRIITVQDRAMLANPHVLNYDSARVELKLKATERDRFVMWSAPLRDMYSGDYHFKDADNQPHWGDVYMSYFQQDNPDPAGGTITKNYFTATFGNPGDSLKLGKAFNLRVTSTSVSRDRTWTFPQAETSYTPLDGPPVNTPRTFPRRFITDGVELDISGQFDLPVYGDITDGDLVQVVNPYLAWLDMAKFLTGNENGLNSSFLIWDGRVNSGFKAVKFDRQSMRYLYTGDQSEFSSPPGYIPPLQSFFVVKKVSPIMQVKMSPAWTTTRVLGSYVLRTSEAESGVLRIRAVQGSRTAYAALHFDKYAAVPEYRGSEDVRALFYDALPLSVYVLTALREPLAISADGEYHTHTTALGLRLAESGETTLEFTGQERFGHNVYLIDRERNNLEIDLQTTPSYTFTAVKPPGVPVFELNDRFVLRMEYTGVGNEPITASRPEVTVTGGTGLIRVRSFSGRMERIDIYNVLGAPVYVATPDTEELDLPIAGAQTYIVKVRAGGAETVKKVIVK